MNNKTPLIFIGGSTGYLEISEIVRRINLRKNCYEIIGILDDNTELFGIKIAGVPVIGDLSRANDFSQAKFVFAIGSHKTRLSRLSLVEKTGLPEERFATLIDPDALVYPGVKIGAGCVIHAGAVIGHETILAPFSIITFQAAIGPYCKIGRGAMITTKATALTGVEIGACTFIGAHSCIGEGVKIGAGALIGMASIVSRNIGEGSIVLGNPARVLYRVNVPEALLQATF